MVNREKVLKGLECCLVFDEDWLYHCDECPYRATEDERKVIDWCCHLEELRKDALELLKEQEPRVLTLEEAKKAEVCWLEQRGYEPYATDDADTWNPEIYGKAYRCWSLKPTDEQRKAVKWDD